jgi:predicted MPP superfamily phosphohydrolase
MTRSRPTLSRRALLIGGGCCCLGAGTLAAFVEPGWLDLTNHDVTVNGLTDALKGFRIAQLSDLHLSALGGLHDRLLAELRMHDPQLVTLTGDVLQDVAALPTVAEFCRALAAPGRDVVATVGNWEYWGDVPFDELAALYESVGVRLLHNQSVRLMSGVVVLGLGDACSGHANVDRTFNDVPAGGATLLLTHAPGILDELPVHAPRFDLALAGHTHGGQVRILGGAPWVPPGSGRFRSGMYETEKGRAYVSRGIGTSVFPVRFTCRPELPIFRLNAA